MGRIGQYALLKKKANHLRRNEGIKATVGKVLNATWQRCRVHFMRNARAAGASSPPSDDVEASRAQWRRVADQLRPKLRKLASFLDEAETDVLA
jgi:transposase-like protein